jgi:3-isopropylmalate/(R)-2-methylmalate dehydratase large subunit
MSETLYDRLMPVHVVAEAPSVTLLYVNRHLLHEVSSPQAFAGLAARGLDARRPGANLAVADHAVPTHNRDRSIVDPLARDQVARHASNCTHYGIPYLALDDVRQGIVHVIGPEQGFTLPGITLVCSDSHTATHGAFGALAFGIGASEAECVLATQILHQKKARTMRVRIDGEFGFGVTAKVIILALIGQIGTAGAAGHAIEYQGEAVRTLSMEARMTFCNMSIEAGSRTGLVAPDAKTFAWIEGRPMAPKGAAWDAAVAYWLTLRSGPDAIFDTEVTIDIASLAPQVTWGTNPDQVIAVDAAVPAVRDDRDRQALAYIGLQPGMHLGDVDIDNVFVGSCTNGQSEDLRAAANIARGLHVAPGVTAIVVPGSGLVKHQAEAEGLDAIFVAGRCMEWACGPSSRRVSARSSTTTASRTAFCRSLSRRPNWRCCSPIARPGGRSPSTSSGAASTAPVARRSPSPSTAGSAICCLTAGMKSA